MKKRLLSLLLAASMLLSLCACGSSTTANTMKLAQTEGTAHVLDENAEEQPIVEDMNLYTGYDVGTEDASYAWIDLDSVKLLKLDEDSDIAITKDSNKLRVDLSSGSLFFCVLEPLSDDEELELATSNMTLSIRGTTGVLRVVSDSESSLVLIEGEAEVSVPDGSAQTVTTSHVAQTTMNEAGTMELTVRDMYPGDVPEFARDMIAENADIQTKITDNGGNLSDATAPDHVWLDATCTAPRTCADCGLTEGEPIAHTMKEANYQEPATCEVCGYTEGDPLQSVSEKYGYTVNVTALETKYPYPSVTYNNGYDTLGECYFTDCRTVTSDEEHEALDGYEWKTVTICFEFSDDAAKQDGTLYVIGWLEDYCEGNFAEGVITDGELFDVNWYGEEYTQCVAYKTVERNEWSNEGIFYGTMQLWVRVPVGYDGILVTAFNFKNYSEGVTIDAYYDADTLIFRMD